ncbi:hypothetical protein [Pseudoxanthomonas japonensis]|nr:hypothetical protein [Pseudoxanthomonas japonensis]NCT70616.1 hypothetical protein [Xanthomonadaceae bacterium]
MQGRKPADARYRAARTRSLAWIAAMIVSTAGCQGMAMTQESGAGRASKIDNTVADWPLTFVRHNFGATSYSTYGCKVLYNGFLHLSEEDDVLQMSSARAHPDSLRKTSAGYLGVKNFPAPAKVTWRSADGVAHEADVDIGAIFKDRMILHRVPREDVREGVSITDPDIILEVNDRTINVYMRAFVPTRELQIPGNRYSGHRDDLVLAWTRTY